MNDEDVICSFYYGTEKIKTQNCSIYYFDNTSAHAQPVNMNTRYTFGYIRTAKTVLRRENDNI